MNKTKKSISTTLMDFPVQDTQTGLSEQQVLTQLEKFGCNELKNDRTNGLLRVCLNILREPMVLLLLGIGSIYLSLGEIQELYSLLTFLTLIIGITIYQENKTERTLRALKELTSPRAIVIREGKQIRIPGREVVPDDIVILNEGDRVPADILLLKGGPISVDESIISGESFPMEKSPSNEESNIVLSGTLVLRGQALGKVTCIGQETELGKIGKNISENKDEGTPLQKRTRSMVTKLSFLVGILTILIIIAYWLTRGDLMEGILVGLTLAMAILPNEMPAVLLIFLAAGAWRMSKRNVLTRKVPSIEALGGVTYLCVDKTGTLTQNKMVIRKLWNGDEVLDISHLREGLPESFHEVMEFGILASSTNPFDPMEKAIRTTGGILLERTEHLHPSWRLSREYQMSNELLAVSYAWKGEEKEGFIVGAKGAPEAILDLCHSSGAQTKTVEDEMSSMASQGLRVIGVARAFTSALPVDQHELNFEFLGLIGFEDPIREDAWAAVQECQEAGVNVLMITGDHPETAKSIAKEVGLRNTEIALTGKDIQTLSDKDLLTKLKEVHIYCRMKPMDKLRIVSLLKSAGEVVAMTGDGVNDAPALRKAQIGIAMGKRGTDVAREASSVVLLDDSFSSIVAGIRTGRRIYQNLQKAFSYLLAIHIPITLLSIVPVIFNLPIILLPVHIAFLHLIIEPASTTLFEALPGSPTLMKTQKTRETHVMTKQEVMKSLTAGFIVSVAVIGVFSSALYRGLSAWDARGLTFTTLILSNLFLIYLMGHQRGEKANKNHFKFLSGATIGLLALVLYIPFFRKLFRFEPFHLHDLSVSIIVAMIAGMFVTPLYRKK